MRCHTPNEGARLHSEPEKVGIQIYLKDGRGFEYEGRANNFVIKTSNRVRITLAMVRTSEGRRVMVAVWSGSLSHTHTHSFLAAHAATLHTHTNHAEGISSSQALSAKGTTMTCCQTTEKLPLAKAKGK